MKKVMFLLAFLPLAVCATMGCSKTTHCYECSLVGGKASITYCNQPSNPAAGDPTMTCTQID